MIEEWKNIHGYEGLYQVSNFGRIKSFLRRGSQIGVYQINQVRQLLKEGTKQKEIEIITGLSEATVYRIKHNKVDYGERMLRPTIGTQCRHLDGNPQNNYLSNLKWGTRSENQQDSTKHGTKYYHFQKGHSVNIGTNNPRARLTEDEVKQIKKLKGKFSQNQRAKMFNVSPSTIQNIDDNRTWRHIDV